jgi:magnesium-transporting ATPase (P-type)
LKKEKVAVIRGKYGATQTISVFQLVVGDIILLETGSRIPADCILIEGSDITVDESYYYEDDATAIKKSVATANNSMDYPDPFLLSNTLIMSGSGKAIVCAVGARSKRGIEEDPLDTSSKTALQTKLQNLGGTFTKYAIIAAFIIFVAYLVRFIISIAAGSNISYVEKVAEMFTLSIVIVMVAVPEGLPLAIVMSLAYSVMRMKDDGVLVKDLQSPETMGRVEEICTGKTSTLTKGEMNVA